MDLSTLFFGIVPLLVFVIVDSLSGVKTGVIAAILFAVLEMIYTLVVFKTIDNLTLGSSLLVLVFGVLSFRSNKPIYMKLQPVFLGLICAGVFFVMEILGKPLLILMAEKYQYMMPEQFRPAMASPVYQAMLARLSLVLALGFLIHATLVGISAYYMNKWWWIAIRGIGFYVMLFICVAIVRFT